MEESKQTKIARVLRLPSLANWARQNFRRFDDTRKRVQHLADFAPKHSLSTVYGICADIACRKLLPSKIEEKIAEIENPFARASAREIVPCFLKLARDRNFDGILTAGQGTLPLPIGRGPQGKPLTIPIRPTFLLIEGDGLTPVFMIGWARLALIDYQKQLIATILERSFLTQQDFLGRRAEVLCLPRIRRTRHREPVCWRTNEIDLLSDDQIADQFERYSRAVRDVVKTLETAP
jgi:hypothetical protein